jgi:hypothetical protein
MLKRISILVLSIAVFSCSKEIIQQKLTVDWTPLNGGTVSPPTNAFEKGTVVSMIATPAGEYTFKQWSGSLSGTNNPAPLTIDSDKQVTGVFEKRQYPLTLTIEGSGTVKEEVIAIAPQAQYPSGTTVRLTPQPADKYEFGGWSGELTSSANPLDLKIDKAISLKALFQKIKFPGYKVDLNAKQLGKEYWENLSILSDLMVISFQQPYGSRTRYSTFLNQLVCGDFNNDGWVDVYNPGATYDGIQGSMTFLIWDPLKKTFEEKNLLKDKSITSFDGNKIKVIPEYINGDNYVDLVLFTGEDEANFIYSPKKLKLLISDGGGQYEVVEVNHITPAISAVGGDIADLNGDKIPDLVLTYGSVFKILWGQKNPPYFTTTTAPIFPFPIVNLFGGTPVYFTNDNGFGESCLSCIENNVNDVSIIDINKDGWNDLVLQQTEIDSDLSNGFSTKILLNKGGGKFNNSSIVRLPHFNVSSTKAINQEDYRFDDLNDDGKIDIIVVNQVEYRTWNIFVYLQNSSGGFEINYDWIQYSINTQRKGFWKPNLIYQDFNGDGKKDICYLDSADNGEISSKSVFIRTGSKFIETDYYQFDDYAKDLLLTLKK